MCSSKNIGCIFICAKYKTNIHIHIVTRVIFLSMFVIKDDCVVLWMMLCFCRLVGLEG
jgi:hypothetical protein